MDFILKGIRNLLGNLFGGMDSLFGGLGQPRRRKRPGLPGAMKPSQSQPLSQPRNRRVGKPISTGFK